MDKLHIFMGVKIEVSNNSLVQSHYPPYENVHVILLKFKIATTNRLFEYL